MPAMATPISTEGRDGEGFFELSVRTGVPLKCGRSRVLLNAARFLHFAPLLASSSPPPPRHCAVVSSSPRLFHFQQASPRYCASPFVGAVFNFPRVPFFLFLSFLDSVTIAPGVRVECPDPRQSRGKSHIRFFAWMGIRRESVNTIWYV